MKLLRHLQFLRDVLLFSITAFGGPQGHLGMMIKTFVLKRKHVTEEELMEFNAFCQMLPGPSSTQTVVLIAYKRGGVSLAILTLLCWILPASIMMGAFSFLLLYINAKDLQTNLFKYVLPMSVGFIVFAAARMMKASINHVATAFIMIGAAVVAYYIRTPWVFPLLLLVAGSISKISSKRIPRKQKKSKPIKWMNLWVFFLIFLIAGILSEVARIQHWEHRRIFNLFENFFRFGTFVFGGSQALIPMMLYQFVHHPLELGQPPLLSATQLLTGYGMVQALPGPVFSICSFVGGLIMSPWGSHWQVLGCITASIAIFLPSTLLLLFLYPLYENLKQHVIIYRALEGILAAIVGIVAASGVVLFQSMPFEWLNVVVVLITFCVLNFTKIPSPLIVLGWLLMGLAIT